MPEPTLESIAGAFAASGLILRGGLVFGDEEEPPPGPTGAPARSLLLVGQAGGGAWPHFTRWRARQPAGLADPLDTWSRRVIGAVAESFGARAVSPSDRPWLPFQQWAVRAEGLLPSPLGILMHPDYGLWHAYRGALLFEREVAVPVLQGSNHPCDACPGKPCLNACPVGAYSGGGFARDACLGHVRGPAGAACRDRGCLARNACPYGTDHRYPAGMQAFHQRAFAGLNSRR